MAAKTAAQEEFDSIVAKTSAAPRLGYHRADDDDYRHDRETSDRDEEEQYVQRRVDENMRMPSLGGAGETLKLPPPAFDEGRTTGVKGVIADARSYEDAKRNGSWRNKLSRSTSNTRIGNGKEKRASSATFFKDDGEGSASENEDFLERWRQQRREELEKGSDIRNRRTSPSVRRFGRFDEVDAMGYLDAIEKVGRDTIVVVFVYDHEVSLLQPFYCILLTKPQCAVSQVIQDALTPLVPTHPAVHFVKVHYEEIEFDNAGVPAILAYKNQGDLFANLTYIIDQIPDDTLFDTHALEKILRKHQVL